jgi:hypothetical protein
MILPCTDCGRPCGSATCLRLRCRDCQKRFDKALYFGLWRAPDADRRIELYARRYEWVATLPSNPPSIFEPIPGVG